MIHSALLTFVCASILGAQQPAPNSAPLSRDQIAALAKAHWAITVARDSSNVQLAKPANKKDDVQVQLKDKFATQFADILHHHGLTDADYRSRTFLISVDTGSRRVYDSVMVTLSGAPLPGTATGAQAKLPVPAGPAGIHIGHVVNTFTEAPVLMGLLPAAIAEARLAAQHANLAARQPTNLDYMKTHAGHVINALDPKLITAGPGLQYGVKRAAEGVAAHIELAAKAEGATPGITVHATHIAMCARNTITRVDQIIALAQRLMTSSTAAEAATLVTQMISLADQLIAGADANSDGRITWEAGEGGLQVADEHAKLMLGVR
ncbi:MAG: hypothetical protein AABZ80_11055 [Gemmatimonadota bacterium]